MNDPNNAPTPAATNAPPTNASAPGPPATNTPGGWRARLQEKFHAWLERARKLARRQNGESFEHFFVTALAAVRGKNPISKLPTVDERRSAWRIAVADFRKHLRTGKSKRDATQGDLDSIWNEAKVAAGVIPIPDETEDEKKKAFAAGNTPGDWTQWAKEKPDETEWLITAYNELLDLNIQGGLQHVPTPGARRRSQAYENPTQRQDAAPHLDQFVFATNGDPNERDSDSKPLDEFVASIVDGYTGDGVTFIAGVRGSGKSTTLSRILWFANNWIKDSQRALWLRIDLGTAFDSSKFLLNFMRVLSKQAREHAHRQGAGYIGERRSFGSFITFCWASISAAGRWCEASMAWAVIALLVCGSLLALDRVTVPPEPEKAIRTWDDLKTNLVALANTPTNLQAASDLSQWAVFAALTNLSNAQAAASLSWIAKTNYFLTNGGWRLVGQSNRLENFLQLKGTLATYFNVTNRELPLINAPALLSSNLVEIVSNSAFPTYIPAVSAFTNFTKLAGKWPSESDDPGFSSVHDASNNLWIIPNRDYWKTNSANATSWINLVTLVGPKSNSFTTFEPDATNVPAFRGLGSLASLTQIEPLQYPLICRVLRRHPAEGAICLTALCILLVGFCHRSREVRSDDDRGLRPSDSLYELLPLAAFCFFWLSLLLVFLFGLRGLGWDQARDPILVLRLFAACALLLLTAVCVACWWLPRHWNVYAECYRVLLNLQRRESPSAADLPWIDKFSGLAKSLFPAADETRDMNDMDGPFLEEEVKRLFEKVQGAYGRIIILIDDVDALPNDKLPDLIRLLRPFSKVRNVRTVVAVPRYFYEAFHRADASDFHSTVTRTVMLADPYLFHGPAGVFATRETAVEFQNPETGRREKRIVNLFCKSFRPSFNASEPAGKSRTRKINPETWDYFKFMKTRVEAKLDDLDKAEEKRKAEEKLKPKPGSHLFKPSLQSFLDDFGPSRREILREVRQWLARPGERELFRPTHSTKEDLEKFRKDYCELERMLLCAKPNPEPVTVKCCSK